MDFFKERIIQEYSIKYDTITEAQRNEEQLLHIIQNGISTAQSYYDILNFISREITSYKQNKDHLDALQCAKDITDLAKDAWEKQEEERIRRLEIWRKSTLNRDSSNKRPSKDIVSSKDWM